MPKPPSHARLRLLPSSFILPPSSSRLPPFDTSPTRTRTRNTSLEARDDYPFHHRAGHRRGAARRTAPALSGRHGIRTHIPIRGHALAVRPGKPYPATFLR